jgi:capsid protein
MGLFTFTRNKQDQADAQAALRAFTIGHYEGAQRHDRNRSYPIYSYTQDAKVSLTQGTRLDLTGISQWLYNNSGLYRGACMTLGRYALIGHPQSQSEDRAWAQAAELAWREWAKIPEITGRYTDADLQRLVNIAVDRDGDIGLALTNGDFPQLQVVESHRIGDKDGETVDGVRVNALGRPVAYRVLLDEGAFRDIPAASFLHIYEPHRSSGYRGECAWSAGLNHCRDIKDIVAMLKTAVKAESSIALIKKVNGGYDQAAQVEDWGTATTASGATVNVLLEQVYGGRVPRLDVNEDLKSLATDRPSQNVQAFLELLIRDFCLGNGLPFEFVWNTSALGGASQRFVISQAQRRIAERQALIERHWSRVFGWVVAKLAKRGDIPPLPDDWWKVRWQRPAEVSVDVGREQAQDRADFQAGLIDPYEFYSRQGLDADDVLASRARWAANVLKVAQDTGVPVGMLYQSTPNGNAPQQAPEPPAAPKPDKPEAPETEEPKP